MQDVEIVRKAPSKQNKTTERNGVLVKKKHRTTGAAAVLVRRQVVLVFLSSAVALCSPSGGGGVVSSFSVCTFLHPVDPAVTGARSWVCVEAARNVHDRPLSLSLRWNGHGQFT